MSFFISFNFSTKNEDWFPNRGTLVRTNIFLRTRKKNEEFTKLSMNASPFDISVSGTEAELRVPAG